MRHFWRGTAACGINEETMNQPQTGVYAEPNLHGITILLNVMTDDVEVMQRKIARIPQLLDGLEQRFSEAMLNGLVAIGSDYWDVLYPEVRPLQLSGFPDCSDGDRQTPRESADLLMSIRSDRFDVNFLAARTLLEWLGHDVEDRKSTRLNSSHVKISYAVFCLKKK